MEDMKLLLAIRQTRFLYGSPDEERISKFKEQMAQEGYIRISSELAAKAKNLIYPDMSCESKEISATPMMHRPETKIHYI